MCLFEITERVLLYRRDLAHLLKLFEQGVRVFGNPPDELYWNMEIRCLKAVLANKKTIPSRVRPATHYSTRSMEKKILSFTQRESVEVASNAGLFLKFSSLIPVRICRFRRQVLLKQIQKNIYVFLFIEWLVKVDKKGLPIFFVFGKNDVDRFLHIGNELSG
jgi:hypothetical protein